MAKKAVRKFTDDERKMFATAARHVWREIGHDLGDAEMSKAEVVEVVLDADRFIGRLKVTAGTSIDLVARAEADIYGKRSEIEKFLKTDVFTFARYGV